MTNYAQINSQNELVEVCNCKLIEDSYGSTDVNNYEVSEEEYGKYKEAPYKYNGVKEKEVEVEIVVPDYDEVGNPIIIEYVDTEVVIDYDEEGNPTGTHEITVKKQKQQTHIETITKTVWVLTEDPEWEEKQAQKEREKIQLLTCTKRVFALILQEKGVGYSKLKELISSNEQAQLEWDLCEKLERNNPLIDAMAQNLGYTSKDIDDIFIKANM